MKYNSYLVELNHRDANITATLELDGHSVPVNLKELASRLYIAYFKHQIALTFMQQIQFKNRDKKIVILLPLLSKYNKRKLKKISNYICSEKKMEITSLLLNLLEVEKFLEVKNLLDFFTLEHQATLELLVQLEIKKEVKILEFSNLSIMAFHNYLEIAKDFRNIIGGFYQDRTRSVKLTDIETKLKLPRSSLFFRYLVRSLQEEFSLKIFCDKIVFQKLALSDHDREAMTAIEQLLRKKKLNLFTVEDVIKESELKYKEVNDTLWYMLEAGEIVQLNEEYFIFSEDLNKILNRMKKHKRNQDETIDIQSFREMTLFNRKKLIILFEYFDAKRITERVGNKRRILLNV